MLNITSEKKYKTLKNLEMRGNTEKTSYNENVRKEIPEFTQKEIQAAIDSLKKASDNNGIRAADIKTYDETTKEMIRQIFNEVLKQEDCTPEPLRKHVSTWFAKNVEEFGNYRPICTRSAFYKLFSTIKNNRLYSRRYQAQPEDQRRFRRSYQTLDHLATYRLLEQMPGVEYQNVRRDSGLHEGI